MDQLGVEGLRGMRCVDCGVLIEGDHARSHAGLVCMGCHSIRVKQQLKMAKQQSVLDQAVSEGVMQPEMASCLEALEAVVVALCGLRDDQSRVKVIIAAGAMFGLSDEDLKISCL